MQLKPGTRPEFMKVAAKLKPLIDDLGTELNFLQVTTGGDPNTVLGITSYDTLADYAKISAAITSSASVQEVMAEVSTLPQTSMKTTLYEDIVDEVGGPDTPVESAQILLAIRLKVLPGKRAGYINMVKQIREVRMADGLPVLGALECKIGEGGLLVRSRTYENLEAYAEAASLEQPRAVQDIIEIATRDPAFPFVENLGSRLMVNITGAVSGSSDKEN